MSPMLPAARRFAAAAVVLVHAVEEPGDRPLHGRERLSWQLGFITAPAIGGIVLGSAPLLLWPALAVVSLVAAAYVLRIEPLLPVGARSTPIR